MLFLSESKVQDLAPLRGLPHLSKLYLKKTPVKDLTPLRKVASLKWLWVKGQSKRQVRALQAALPRLAIRGH